MTNQASTVPITPGNGVTIATYLNTATGAEYQQIVPVDAAANPISVDPVSGGLNVTNVTASRQDLDSVTSFSNGKLTSAVITATGQAVAVPGKIHGIFVASGTPTITAYDGTSTSGVVKLPAFTVAAAPYYLGLPAISVATGLYLSITGTTSLVVFYDTTTG